MKVTIPNKVKSKPPQVQCGLLFIFTRAPATCFIAQFSLKLMTPPASTSKCWDEYRHELPQPISRCFSEPLCHLQNLPAGNS